MRWLKVAMLVALFSATLLTGCAATILNDSEQVFESDGVRHDGYAQISKGALAKILKCCNDCLDKKGVAP